MNAPVVRTFKDHPAVRQEVPLHVGIMSPSGGGKTFSALRLATGIQSVVGGDIYGVDTENKRMLDYADLFKFRHVPFKPPFGSLDYLNVIKYCIGKGARVIIVDSMTHEHIGEGGYLETAENVITRIAGDDWKKREACKMLGWATAGPLRQKMIEGIKQFDGAFIWCFRAKEKSKPIRDAKGKTEVVDMGFMPIAGEDWIYEMSVNCMLEPRSNGVPTWRSDYIGEKLMMKLPEQFKGIFAEKQPLSEDIGRALATWSRGGTSNPPSGQESTRTGETPARLPSPMGAGRLMTASSLMRRKEETESERLTRHERALAEAAEHGEKELRKAWSGIRPKSDQKTMEGALRRRFQPRAAEVDGAEVGG